jgi:serine/threonine protein kinase
MDTESDLSTSKSRSNKTREKKKKVSKEDFDVKKLIGKGGFGQVYLAEHKPTGRIMALKQMNKQLIIDKNKVEHVKNERRILIKGKSAYLVRLHYAFKDEESLYLAMEYCSGGDLKVFLGYIGVLEDSEARIYFAEMIMGVYTLHQLGYIHRDLKPDNFLIDSKGHLKLADFGLSKAEELKHSISDNYKLSEEDITKVQQALRRQDEEKENIFIRNSLLPKNQNWKNDIPDHRQSWINKNFRRTESFLKLGRAPEERKRAKKRYMANSVVGSPDYMSPEVTSNLDSNLESGDINYGEEVDWWSLGCVFFEMVLGAPPFEGDTPHEIFSNIKQWKNIIPDLLDRYSDQMSSSVKHLISGMLCEKDKRLGKEIDDFKNHPFFDGIDWDNLQDLEPPFVLDENNNNNNV